MDDTTEVTQRMRLTCLDMSMRCSASVEEALYTAALFEHYVTTGEALADPRTEDTPEVIDVDDLTEKTSVVDLFKGGN